MTDPVGEIMGAWAGAFARNDPQALSSLYSENALFFGSRPELMRGREGAYAYFSSLSPRQSAAVEFSDIATVHLTQDIVSAAMIGRFTIDGVEHRVPIRFTFLIVLENGAWRISSHHASPQNWD